MYAGKVKFTTVNVDNAPRTASRYGIRGVPAIYFMRSGEVFDQAVGALSKSEIERRLKALIRQVPE